MPCFGGICGAAYISMKSPAPRSKDMDLQYCKATVVPKSAQSMQQKSLPICSCQGTKAWPIPGVKEGNQPIVLGPPEGRKMGTHQISIVFFSSYSNPSPYIPISTANDWMTWGLTNWFAGYCHHRLWWRSILVGLKKMCLPAEIDWALLVVTTSVLSGHVYNI